MMRPLLEMLLFIVALATHTRGLPYGASSPQLQTQDQIVWYGDNRASQIQNTVFPTYKENIVPQQTGQAQFNWDQSQQNTFEGYETHASSESQEQYNPDYVYQSSDQTLQSYPNAVDDFTISCNGQNKICVAKSLCIDGYVHPLKQGFIRPGQVQECKLSHEICCTVRYDLTNSPYDNDQINTVLKDNRYPEPTLENDQRYVPYGENNQADVAELKPELGSDAELQTAPNNGHAIESANHANQLGGDTKPTEEAPIDYNQIAADTNQQEQYQTGDASASEPVFPPLKSAPTNSNSAVFQFPVQAGCAAALLCVEEQYCTLEGVISPEPVALSSKQLLRRVPLTSCRNSETGVVGKCCRDPNYVDPWPTGNLPANYTGGFDEQGFPTFLNIATVRPPKKPVTQSPIKTSPKPPAPQHEHSQPTNVVPLVPDHSDLTPQHVPIPTQVPIVPISTPVPFIKNPYDIPTNQDIITVVPQLPNNPCGVRNYGQRPPGFRITDAAFGEIPWQVMVLWSEERKILCSGALISSDVVLTAASCVNRFSPNELSVKLGEWKLGYELKYEEPLPFEIIPVRTIKYHPGYVQGLSSNDTAILLLEHPTTFNLHINTLCLPDDYQVQESQCIVTGWGKSILQAHYAGAIMHMVDVDLLSQDVCQNRVLGAESHINIAHNVICGKARNDNNMCQADIGSPLACYDGNGAYHIAGIYSQDTGCLPTNQVATFSPIDVPWVKQIMSETNLETAQTIDNGYDYRKSNLPAEDQIVWYGDNRASQIQNTVFPTYKENIVPQQTGQAQFNWDQSQQNTFEGYETHASSESQEQYNPDYVYQSSDQTLQSYPNAVDDFTISCNGQNKICVAKSLCIDGYVHPLKQGFIRPGQVQECKLSHEICCTVRYDLTNSPYDNDQINTVLKDNRYPEPTLENDQRYVPYGENNQADVAELKPELGSDAELQTAPNNGHAIESANHANQLGGDTKPTEEAPIDYNQIAADTNQQEQYQTGDASASEPVFPPLKSAPTNSNSAVFQFPVQAGCAAALLCVEEQYCTLEGVISPEPVALSSKQLLRRVPLTSCRNSETGVVGKCCRDPNYVDPWPTGNLPANYTGGFDEQGFPTFLNIATVRPPKKPVTQSPIKTSPKPPAPQHEHSQPTNVVPLVPDHSDLTPQHVPIPSQVPIVPISTPVPFIKNPYDIPSNQDIITVVPQLPNNPCGIRNYGQCPPGFKITDAAFGEIPWQVMVLWSEERKILCSGALISSDVVLTAASCVNRFSPNELSVKLGEWKLGYELKYEEPLPFEIIPVRTIKYHPGYVQGLSSNDTAILLLEHPTTFNLHINTLCLPDDYQVQESQCIVTGWGKSILQAHYAGAIMHMVDVDLLSQDVCQNRVLGAESHINIAHNVICGKARNDNNMCQADIGSPLACYDGNGAYHIAGIYSQDTGCLPTNQVATFSPIDVPWVKQIMSETNLETAQTIDNGYDYRKSNLPAGNQYLPPV